MTDTMISARGLERTFTVAKQTVHAVRGLDLEVRRGELLAFLGPNGAGKSTSLRMLTTLLAPSAGEAIVAGHDIRREPSAVRRRIGLVGQGTSAGHNQRVRDELLSQAAFYGLGRSLAARRADELLESLELAPLAKRSVQGLSGGQQRRLDIALGLVHEPELLFLDEPSTGLDPQSRANLWQHITELRERTGTTVVVTTHYLEEADRFAERVVVMDDGRLIADDTATSLKGELAGDRLTLRFASATDAASAAAVVAPHARTAPSVEGERMEAAVEHGDALLPRLIVALAAAGLTPVASTLREPTLDDVFLALTGRSLRESGAASASATAPQEVSA